MGEEEVLARDALKKASMESSFIPLSMSSLKMRDISLKEMAIRSPTMNDSDLIPIKENLIN